VQEISNIQVVTLVYEDKVTKQHDRIVIKHDELTNKTVIVEQTTLPSVIEKVVFEKDTSVQG
jgi:hypothetical protein